MAEQKRTSFDEQATSASFAKPGAYGDKHAVPTAQMELRHLRSSPYHFLHRVVSHCECPIARRVFEKLGSEPGFGNWRGFFNRGNFALREVVERLLPFKMSAAGPKKPGAKAPGLEGFFFVGLKPYA
jgi:hypothetical protein